MSPETCLTFLFTSSNEQELNTIEKVSVLNASPPETNAPDAALVTVNPVDVADATETLDKLYADGVLPYMLIIFPVEKLFAAVYVTVVPFDEMLLCLMVHHTLWLNQMSFFQIVLQRL